MKLLAAWILTVSCAGAQGIITTFAGTDFSFPSRPLQALGAPLGQIGGIASDASGNLYLADDDNSLIYRVDPQGILEIVAGNGVHGFSGDGGPAINAALGSPTSVAVDSTGNLFIADYLNHRVRKVTPSGIITTLAGTGEPNFSGDGGPANQAALYLPTNVATDLGGNIYIADAGNNRVRRVGVDGTITTVAGNGHFTPLGDGGAATKATLILAFDGFNGIAVDSGGNLYIADNGNDRVRKVTPAGIITTAAGSNDEDFCGDGGPATSACLNGPASIAVDATGNLFIADFANNRIRKVAPAGTISTYAGIGAPGFSGDGGPADKARLSPIALLVLPSGDVLLSDFYTHRIRRVSSSGGAPTGRISTIVGNGEFLTGGDGGAATGAVLSFPEGVATDASGNVFIADQRNNRVRKVTPDGVITTVAGNGVFEFSGDGGPATLAGLADPTGVAVDSAGNVFIADLANSRIRKVSQNGVITTVAGNGNHAFTGDGGPATDAALNSPAGVAINAAGTLFIADTANGRIRQVTANGVISTFAGTGKSRPLGDNGPATAAALQAPTAVAVDSAGSVFISDQEDHRIRQVNSAGRITTVAGTGDQDFSGDGGRATSASLDTPGGIAVNAAGDLFLADTGNGRIRRVTAGGIITSVAGNGDTGFSGDGGPATKAALHYLGEVFDASGNPIISLPSGVAVDPAGNLFIADPGNNRIRKVLAAPPQVQASPSQLQFSASSAGAIPPLQTVSFTGVVPGLAYTVQSSADWLKVSPQNGATPRLLEITADPATLKPGTYQGTVAIAAPNASPPSSVVGVTFNITSTQAPRLAIDKQSLSFPFTTNAAPRSQPVVISNEGGGTLSFTAKAQTTSGGNWLSVSPSAGQALPSAPVTLTVKADPSGLSPGTYSGTLTINEQTLAVTLAISSVSQAILLSQSGLSFLGVSQGGIVPPQTFGVINIGTGVVEWTVSGSTLSGGPDWLQIGSTAGSTDAAAATVPTVSVSVKPSILAAGDYYGLVQVDAPDAANSPQVVTVFLKVLPPGSDIGAAATPSELQFVASPAAGAPGSQDLLLYNVAASPKSFRSSVTLDAGLTVVTLPKDGTLDPQRPTRVVVQPLTEGLAPGVYNGNVTLQFSDGRVRALRLSVVVASGTGKGSGAAREATGVCTPATLVQALTTLGQSFNVTAGYPIGLGVQVTDDCGTPLEAGSVSVSFSNGDPTVPLQPVKGGRWEGTWNSQSKNAAQVTLKLQASDPSGALHGERQIQGSAEAQADPPTFDKSGIFSAASDQKFVPLAPGSIISIYGTGLAADTQAYSSTPLPFTLQSTNVLMAGRVLPLYYVSPGQINAQVPFDVNSNTPQQVYIRKGATASQPILVDVAPAQPAIFAIVGSPARAGDVIVIYAAGLGPVSPAVPAGAVPGAALSATTNPVQVTIGGREAQVLFSGLAPGFVGLYQVNVSVPSGVPAGGVVPLAISVAGQSSPQFTLVIQ